MPLAVVTRSGTTPSWSQANHDPVRQNPDWISSAMNTMPLSFAQAARAGRKPGAGSMKPPSPRIGSIAMHARLATPTCLSRWSIARAAASSPDRPSRNGYDIGAR